MVGPGALKPSVGDGIESRRPLVCSYCSCVLQLCLLLFLSHFFVLFVFVFTPLVVCMSIIIIIIIVIIIIIGCTLNERIGS